MANPSVFPFLEQGTQLLLSNDLNHMIPQQNSNSNNNQYNAPYTPNNIYSAPQQSQSTHQMPLTTDFGPMDVFEASPHTFAQNDFFTNAPAVEDGARVNRNPLPLNRTATTYADVGMPDNLYADDFGLGELLRRSESEGHTPWAGSTHPHFPRYRRHT